MKFVLPITLFGMTLALSACQPADKNVNNANAEQKAAESTTPASSLAQAQEAATKTTAAIKVENAYVRAVAPGQENSAAFMTLTNSSDVPVALIAVEASVANTLELHEHTNSNGVMQMRQVPQIEVPAKGSVELKPGGYHIMLLGLKQPLNAGGSFLMTFLFADGGLVQTTVAVKAVEAPAASANGNGKKAK